MFSFLEKVVESTLHIPQHLGVSLEGLDWCRIRRFCDIGDFREDAAPFSEVRAMMRCTEKAYANCAGFDGADIISAGVSRFRKRSLGNQAAQTVRNKDNLALLLYV